MYRLAIRLHEQRISRGAVNIELPEVHISVKDEKVEIQPIVQYNSAFMIRELMIITGESVGTWASGRLAIPYISQEVEMQGDVSDGLAGSWQLRRCMRPRILSTKPARHQGLGLDAYTQVTSPLRRYTDLLVHMQIRAFLRGEKPLSEDEVMEYLGAGEAAAIAVTQAERASKTHWTMVYLSEKKESVWEAVVLEKKGNRWAVIIPSLALELQVPLNKDVSPNDTVKLTLKSVNIPRGEAVFVQDYQ
jgi:exoribonuclease-2